MQDCQINVCSLRSDLSLVDMRKVQSLALIELTALMDLRGIELKRRKSGKSKLKGKNVLFNWNISDQISTHVGYFCRYLKYVISEKFLPNPPEKFN